MLNLHEVLELSSILGKFILVSKKDRTDVT